MAVDQYSDLAMKSKDKSVRRQFMDEVIACKAKTSNVLKLLGQAANANISNE